MYKDVGKRLLALFLCTCMIGTSVDMGSMTAYAAEETTVESHEVTTEQEAEEVNTEDEEIVQSEEVEQSVSDVQAEEVIEEEAQNSGSTEKIDIGEVNAQIIVSKPAKGFVYNGQPHEPTVMVICEGVTLNQTTDYLLSYEDNVNVGTARIMIYGLGNYKGYTTVTFQISAKNFADSSITTNPAELTDIKYTGYPVEPSVVIKDGELTLTKGIDYSITYNTNSRTAANNTSPIVMTFTGIGNYTGTRDLSFNIEPKNIAEQDVSINYSSEWGYTGNAIEPILTIRYNNKTLVEGTDYTVVYADNVGVGTGNITIKGAGNYTGNITKTFQIKGGSIEGATVTLANRTFDYDGTAHKPAVTVELGDKTLVAGTDYRITYTDNTDAGNATLTITGIGNYSGTIEEQFKIVPYDIEAEGAISIDVINDQAYTGQEINVKPNVYVGSIKLVENEDYVLSYANNIDITTDEANPAIVYIRGINNYEGLVSETFNISRINLERATVEALPNWRGLEAMPQMSPVVTYEGVTLRPVIDYTIEYIDADKNTLTAGNPGHMGYVKINGAEGSIYYGSTIAPFFMCYDIEDATITGIEEKYDYTGKDVKPTPLIRMHGENLVEGEDYELTYSTDCSSMGEKTLTITGIGDYANTVEKKYTVGQKDITNATDITCEVGEYPYYTGEEVLPNIVVRHAGEALVEGIDYTVEKDTDALVDATNDRVYIDADTNIPLIIKGKPGSNYTGERKVYYDINKRPLSSGNGGNTTVTGVEGYSAYFTGSPITLSGYSVSCMGTVLTENIDYTVSYKNNVEVGTASIVFTGKGNYSGSVSVGYTIQYDFSDASKVAVTTYPEDVSADTFTATNPQTEFSYTRNAIQPSVKVTYDGDGDADGLKPVTLVEGKDFYVSGYTNNINIGTANIAIKGMGNYDGTQNQSFTIVEKDIADSDVKATEYAEAPLYNGESRDTDVAMSHNGGDLKLGTDFTVSSVQIQRDAQGELVEDDSNYTDAGLYVITVVGMGNYTGTKEIRLTIQKKDISDDDIMVETPADIVYDGNAHELIAEEFVVTYRRPGKSTLRLNYDGTNEAPGNYNGSDYSVTLEGDTTNAGTITATIEGKGNYTGTKKVEYRIVPKALANEDNSLADGFTSKVEVNAVETDSVVYDGTVQNPVLTLKKGDVALVQDEDYTLSLMYVTTEEDGTQIRSEVTECKDAGTYIVQATGINNYSGVYETTYTIQPRDLNESEEAYAFKVDDVEDQTYAAEPIVPELKVYEYDVASGEQNGDNLVMNRDYIVIGERNENVTTDDALAKLTIQGTGNYTGELTVEFAIMQKDISDRTGDVYDVELSEIMNVDYGAGPLNPELPLVYNGHTMALGTDYTVEYNGTNINIGRAYGTITGHGNYTGSRTYEEMSPIFNIVPRSVKTAYNNGDLVALPFPTNLVYDGTEHKPNVYLDDFRTSGEYRMIQDVDYTVTYDEGIAAGTHQIIVQGIENYRDTIILEYNIKPKNLLTSAEEDATIVYGTNITIQDQVYDGTNQTPNPFITDTIYEVIDGVITPKNVTLVKGTDYTVTYTDNCNVGIATATIEFCGNYTGFYAEPESRTTYDVHFNITGRDIADEMVQVAEVPDQVYTGADVEPLPVITIGKRTLVKDVDYTIEYNGNHSDCGTATMTIHGIGNFAGSRNVSYRIVSKPITTAGITVEAIADQTFTGTNIIPDVVVTDGEKLLKKGVDYRLVAGPNSVNPGEATVTIEGIGNYGGQRNEVFRIFGDLSKHGKIADIAAQFYTGEEQCPEVTVSFNGATLKKGTDYEVVYSNNVAVGTASVIVTGKGVYSGVATKTFRVARNIAQAVTTNKYADEYTYTSGQIKPINQVYYNGTLLKEGTDYTLTYKNNINAGNASVVIAGQGNYAGSKELTYRIVRKSIAQCAYGTIASYTYDGKTKKPTLTVKNGSATLKAGTDYIVSYQNNVKPGVAKVVVTGLKNYTGSTIRYFNITVAKPKNFKQSARTDSAITLAWQAGGKAAGYEVYCKQSNGKYKKIATTTDCKYTVTKLAAGKEYTFKVWAYAKGSGGKVNSQFTSALTTYTSPKTPSIYVSTPAKKQVKIAWKKVSSASGYEVYQSTSKNGKYTKIATIKKNSTVSYTKKKLTSGKKYYYKVRAYKTFGSKKVVYGSYSSVKYKKVK